MTPSTARNVFFDLFDIAWLLVSLRPACAAVVDVSVSAESWGLPVWEGQRFSFSRERRVAKLGNTQDDLELWGPKRVTVCLPSE
jgi:hypothetical protein